MPLYRISTNILTSTDVIIKIWTITVLIRWTQKLMIACTSKLWRNVHFRHVLLSRSFLTLSFYLCYDQLSDGHSRDSFYGILFSSGHRNPLPLSLHLCDLPIQHLHRKIKKYYIQHLLLVVPGGTTSTARLLPAQQVTTYRISTVSVSGSNCFSSLYVKRADR